MTSNSSSTAATAATAAATTGPSPVPAHSASGETSTTLVRPGGTAAQVVAGSYVVGFAAMLAYLVPSGFVSTLQDPSGSLEFLTEHHAVLASWYLVLYLLGGAAMALVSLGVGQHLASAPGLARVSTAFGLIWSGLLIASGSLALVGQNAAIELYAEDPDLALTTWVSTSVVQDALGGGIEFAGALWVATVGYAVLRTRVLSAGLGGLALGLGAVGTATVIPAAAETNTSVFGLGMIVWFTWLGVARRRH